jgi:hypothetical protein
MPRLPIFARKETPSAQRVKSRAKEVGSGIPDILAPSAYREVEPSEELIEAAQGMYDELSAAREHREEAQSNGNGGNGSPAAIDSEQARERAEAEGRELLPLRI